MLEFYLNLIEKVKFGFLLSSMRIFPESTGTKNPNLTAFTSEILKTIMDQRGTPK